MTSFISYSLSAANLIFSQAKGICKKEGSARAAWYLASVFPQIILKRTQPAVNFLSTYLGALYRRISGKARVHVIGDSHVASFWGAENFVTYYLGAPTAYNLNKINSTSNSGANLFRIIVKIRSLNSLGHNEVVLLCFGEVDCRIHIYNQYKKQNGTKTIDQLIDDTLANYATTLQKLKKSGVRFFVCGVPPVTEVGNIFGYPFYASPEVRSQISKTFNEKLQALCLSEGYGYIDRYTKFADEDGFMLQEYRVDDVHLSTKSTSFVRQQLRERFGLNV
jgi:GDSL-like Lipase/Acylhydrolase family